MDFDPSSVVHAFANAPVHGWAYNRGMDEERPPHYLREWRRRARFTQEQLAEAVGTSKSQISELERFNIELSPKWLRRLAPVLKVQAGWIIDQNPEDLSPDLLDMWNRIPEDDKPAAAKALSGFVRTGTDD